MTDQKQKNSKTNKYAEMSLLELKGAAFDCGMALRDAREKCKLIEGEIISINGFIANKTTEASKNNGKGKDYEHLKEVPNQPQA